MRPSLHQAVVVITGASSGIGRATALGFAARGAQVVLAARDAAALDEVVQVCESYGTRALAVPTDVCDAQAMQRLAQAAHDFGGRIDVWVNNAGTGAVGAFEDTPMEAHEQVVQIDLLGYMRGAHAVLPYFKQQQSGVLINLQSVGSWVPQPYAAAYSAAKFGLRGFSEALRGELGRFKDVHVCDVFPSFVDTPGLAHGANYSGGTVKPTPPLLDPREVAEAVVWLAQCPRRSTSVGPVAPLLRLVHLVMPAYGWVSARLAEQAMRRAKPVARTDGALYRPPEGKRGIDGGWRISPEAVRLRKLATGAVVLGGAGALLLGLHGGRRIGGGPRP